MQELQDRVSELESWRSIVEESRPIAAATGPATNAIDENGEPVGLSFTTSLAPQQQQQQQQQRANESSSIITPQPLTSSLFYTSPDNLPNSIIHHTQQTQPVPLASQPIFAPADPSAGIPFAWMGTHAAGVPNASIFSPVSDGKLTQVSPYTDGGSVPANRIPTTLDTGLIPDETLRDLSKITYIPLREGDSVVLLVPGFDLPYSWPMNCSPALLLPCITVGAPHTPC